ncbi:Uncharacterised protein [uncultured archaeon]|nr:Uncharacterised protein [uncultured archaeon]
MLPIIPLVLSILLLSILVYSIIRDCTFLQVKDCYGNPIKKNDYVKVYGDVVCKVTGKKKLTDYVYVQSIFGNKWYKLSVQDIHSFPAHSIVKISREKVLLMMIGNSNEENE